MPVNTKMPALPGKYYTTQREWQMRWAYTQLANEQYARDQDRINRAVKAQQQKLAAQAAMNNNKQQKRFIM